MGPKGIARTSPPPPPPTQREFTGGMFYGDYGPHGPEIISVSLDSMSSMAVETTDVVDGWVPKFEDGTKKRLSITALKVTGDPNVPAGRLTFASSSELKKFGEVPPSGDPGSNCSCQNPCDCWVLRDEGYEVEGYMDGYGKTAMSRPNVYSNPKWSEARMYVLRSFCGGGEEERTRDGRGGVGATITMTEGEREEFHWACLLKFTGDMKTSFALREFNIEDPPKFGK